MPSNDDTIAAIATAPGRGGIGVVRVSGKRARHVMVRILGREGQPRVSTFGAFCDAGGRPLDRGLALFFPGPHSYTGEDVVEFQGHGGPVVMNLLLRRCVELGARLAEPGEFTRRAFLNDKIDLAQAEAVADLIDAASERAARAALRSLDGEFSREVGLLFNQLVELRALVEATLDFPEEEIDFLKRAQAHERLAAIGGTLAGLQQRGRQGARLRAGFSIVLAGRPNVGKSSLLNALAGEEAAIVTAVPGTTRDTVHRAIVIDGMLLNVIDTAGLRDTTDEVEAIGIERTRRELARADLVLHMVEAAGEGPLDALAAGTIPAGITRLKVINKIDTCGGAPGLMGGAIGISAKSGAGLDVLRAELLRLAGLEGAGEDVVFARERHMAALNEAAVSVEAANDHLGAIAPPLELLAEELRHAQEALGAITGEFSADDLLGEIFGRFCIGK
jgi:tRNA modification GTPase